MGLEPLGAPPCPALCVPSCPHILPRLGARMQSKWLRGRAAGSCPLGPWLRLLSLLLRSCAPWWTVCWAWSTSSWGLRWVGWAPPPCPSPIAPGQQAGRGRSWAFPLGGRGGPGRPVCVSACVRRRHMSGAADWHLLSPCGQTQEGTFFSGHTRRLRPREPKEGDQRPRVPRQPPVPTGAFCAH